MAEERKAIQRVVRGQDGTLRIILIDLATLQPVEDATGYKIITANTPIEEVADVNEPDPQPIAQAPTEEVQGETGSTGDGARDRGGYKTPGTNLGRFPDVPSTGTTRGNVTRVGTGQTISPVNPSTIAGQAQGLATTASRAGTTNTASRVGSTSQVATRSPVGQSLTSTTPGVGLTANLAGKHRSEVPDAGFLGSITDAVGKSRGLGSGFTVDVTSGKDPDGTSYSGSGRHEHGVGADFGVIDNSTGQRVTDDRMKDLAAQYAFDNPDAGIGFGQNYMGAGLMHIDKSGKKGNWGAKGLGINMDPALANTIDAARKGFGPTPFSNAPAPFGPDDEQGPATATGDYNQPTGPLGELAAGAQQSMGKGYQAPSAPTKMDKFSGIDITNNPAALSALGYGPKRSAEDIASMAYAFAGELAPGQLSALKANDPTAVQELANMVATVENRAQSKRFQNKTLADVLTPSQYNSLTTAAKAVTSANFAQYKDVLTGVITDYYNPASNVAPSVNASHYYNPEVATPSWGAGLIGAQQVGDHRFGRLSAEYAPNSGFASSADSYARGQINNQTSKGGYQPDLGRFSDMGPAFGDYDGVSYSGQNAGFDTPSETRGTFGGSGNSTGSRSSTGGRGRGGFAAGGNSSPSGQSTGGRGRGGYAAGGNSTTAGSKSGGGKSSSTGSKGGAGGGATKADKDHSKGGSNTA